MNSKTAPLPAERVMEEKVVSWMVIQQPDVSVLDLMRGDEEESVIEEREVENAENVAVVSVRTMKAGQDVVLEIEKCDIDSVPVETETK